MGKPKLTCERDGDQVRMTLSNGGSISLGLSLTDVYVFDRDKGSGNKLDVDQAVKLLPTLLPRLVGWHAALAAAAKEARRLGQLPLRDAIQALVGPY